MFLEPLSQIVTKEVVGAVKTDLSVEKVQSIGKPVAVMQSNCISEYGQRGECFRISSSAGDASKFAGHETNCKNSARITLVAPQISCRS